MAEYRAATIWEQRVGGSNPSAPTIQINHLARSRMTSKMHCSGYCGEWASQAAGKTLWFEGYGLQPVHKGSKNDGL